MEHAADPAQQRAAAFQGLDRVGEIGRLCRAGGWALVKVAKNTVQPTPQKPTRDANPGGIH